MDPVEEGQVIDHLVIKVFPEGRLLMRLTGFETLDNRDFQLSMTRPEASRLYRQERIDESGTWESARPLEKGQWVASFSFQELGFLERGFEIQPGHTTEIRLHKDAFSRFEGNLSVCGSLDHADGSPLPATRLRFSGYGIPGLEEKNRFLSCVTDAAGKFTLDGFRPGCWRILMRMESGTHLSFPDLVIPPSPIDPFPVHLVLPQGTVVASLYDRSTGLSFSEKARIGRPSLPAKR